jgi:hypothetical protein
MRLSCQISCALQGFKQSRASIWPIEIYFMVDQIEDSVGEKSGKKQSGEQEECKSEKNEKNEEGNKTTDSLFLQNLQ